MRKILLAAGLTLAMGMQAQVAPLPSATGKKACTLPSTWQKQIFIPDSLKPYNLNDDESRWSWRHATQTQNLVFFWEKGFGDDTSNPPTLDGKPMAFDIGTQLQPILHKQEYAKPGDQLPQKQPVIIDIATGKKVEADKQAIENQYELEWMQWAEDGREVTMEFVMPGVHHTMGEDFGEHKRYDFFVRHLLGVNPPKWSEIK